MLSRFLDYLDEAAGGPIRLTYLLAGITHPCAESGCKNSGW
jgi:hypothetical protein